ncbi:(5-formylfuran-3-yl)methyl phosphate synthase [Variovorax paradoxus]|uniref:(5-formylfuran-3-yl)methyl phosphate synthase n=1 Tax=Variovorax paradoxus TaxID=34073 RepID=UPI002480803B|nr:(5-formylfuran-3-yl)methyl phosphate synthase [Variovorax paradoxus]WGT66471.1 (5-formylfuran-3-yl)methyl phosphate synthase [Variovorax paradoxus]
MLVSVRSVDEALTAARGGADFIDLKEPNDGALGGLPVATIGAVVHALRAHGIGLPVSATIGDLPMHALDGILAQVDAVGACGVDYVKVGIERGPAAFAVLDALAACEWAVVPVFIADQGLDTALVAHACSLGFPALMADTADKLAGSLFDAVPTADLRAFVAQVRAAGRLVGLAGALRMAHVPLLQSLAPDFAGFRSAVCVADRKTALCPERLAALAASLHAEAAEAATA